MADIELPWSADHSRQQEGLRSEARTAKERGARLHPRSGAGRIKADMSTDTEVIEHKDAMKQYALKSSELLTLLKQAVPQGKEPVFIVYFNDGDIAAEIHVKRGRP